MVIAERIWVKKSAVMVTSTSVESDGSMPRLCILRIGGMPCRMFISIGNASETWAPDVLDLLPGEVGHAGHVDEQVVRADADVVVDAARACGEVVHDRANAERRQDMRRDLEVELAADRPGLGVRRVAQVDLAAHDHVDELIARGEPLLLDAGRVGGIAFGLPAAAPALSK